MPLQVPRLLAISPPKGEVNPKTIDIWKETNLDQFGLAVLIREPERPLYQILDPKARLAPLIRACLEANIPMLLSASFDDLIHPVSRALIEQKRSNESSRFVGIQVRGNSDANQLAQIRQNFSKQFLIGHSCHGDPPEKHDTSIDYICFAPVFSPQTLQERRNKMAVGIDILRAWCLSSQPIPVLALGGISPVSAEMCLSAGAFGIAGIHQFFGPLEELRLRSTRLSEILHCHWARSG